MSYSNIIILTGAGISKESGLDTFRDKDGIWSKVNLEDVCTPEALQRNPQLVQDFYNARRKQLLEGDIKPNAAHLAIAELEKKHDAAVTIVTQNIDDLHEKAGSRNIIHIHGELLKSLCSKCANDFVCKNDISLEDTCAYCNAEGTLRPQVVFFGEMPLEMGRVYALLSSCDLFISIGTSGNVYPAAGFVEIASQAGADTIELNLEPSEGATLFKEQRYGPATSVVPDYFEELINS